MTRLRSLGGALTAAAIGCVLAATPAHAIPRRTSHARVADAGADSLYLAGREALARRDYHGAAALLRRWHRPTPHRASPAMRCSARVRAHVSGNATHAAADYRGAVESLDETSRRYPAAAATWNGAELRARVIGAEAAAGDLAARGALRDATAALARPVDCADPGLPLQTGGALSV